MTRREKKIKQTPWSLWLFEVVLRFSDMLFIVYGILKLFIMSKVQTMFDYLRCFMCVCVFFFRGGISMCCVTCFVMPLFFLRRSAMKKSNGKPRKIKEKTITSKKTKKTHVFPYAQNGKSREFDSRDLFWFWGHNSAPWSRIRTKLGGDSSYRPLWPF